MLNKSEKKKLISLVEKHYLDLDKETLSQLISAKANVSRQKLAGSRTCIYSLEGNPIFFQKSEEEDLWPTVYLLWKVPDLLPSFTCHRATLEFLQNGADLMSKGITFDLEEDRGKLKGLEGLLRGERRCVKLKGLHAPVCVGQVLKSFDELKQDFSGKILKVEHVYGDSLWSVCFAYLLSFFGILFLAPKFLKRELGNKQKLPDNKEIEENSIKKGQQVTSEKNSKPNKKKEEKKEGKKEHKRGKKQAESNSKESVEENVGEKNEGSLEEKGKEEKVEDVVVDSKELVNEKRRKSEEEREKERKEMEELFYSSFFNAVKSRLKNSELPVLLSTFYKSHMAVCCPEGKSLKIQSTRWKKLSAFFEDLKQQGVVDLDTPKPGVLSLKAVNRKHPSIQQFKATVDKLEAPSSQKKPLVTILYKPNKLSKFLFPEYEKETYFLLPEARQALLEYLKQNPATICEDKQFLVCDENLERMWNHKFKVGEKIPKKQLGNLLEDSLRKFHLIERGDFSQINNGLPKQV